MEIDPINFDAYSFDDIVAKDPRYNVRAYAFLATVLEVLMKEDQHVGSDAILDEFKEWALDQYGPLTYTVLTEWGLSSTHDIGEMMHNLVENKYIGQDVTDNFSDFDDVYDFKGTFLAPYQT